MTDMIFVQYVEEHPVVRSVAKKYLEQTEEISADVSSTVKEAFPKICSIRFDVVVIAYPGEKEEKDNLIEFLCRQGGQMTPVILFTSGEEAAPVCGPKQYKTVTCIRKDGKSPSPLRDLYLEILRLARPDLPGDFPGSSGYGNGKNRVPVAHSPEPGTQQD